MKFNVKNKTICVWLPNKLFKKLKEVIGEYNKSDQQPKFSLAQAAFQLNLVIYIQFQYRGDKYEHKFEDGWVPICSKIHNNIYNFSKCMQFLEKSKLIERTSYIKGLKCRRYRLVAPFHKQMVKRIEIPAHKNFVRKRQEEVQARMRRADQSVPHLTRWLTPENFQMDVEGALKFIKREYRGQNKKIREQKRHRLMTVESFDHGDWRYSREGEDNRLHSLLTTLPTDMRSFVKYQNSPLSSIDIKNSQPFVLSALLNNSIEDIQYVNTNKIIDRDVYKEHSSIMFDKADKARLYGNLKRFIDEVVSGTFYEEYGRYITEESLLMTNFGGKFFYHKQGNKGYQLMEYSELRKAAKDILFQTLFSSHTFSGGIPRYIELFNIRYPEVFEIIQNIKKQKPEQKNYFPTLLQRIEADFMLDYTTRIISEKYPEIPLLTIHDSIVTKDKYIEIVERELKAHLKDYFGIMPELKIEPWCLDQEKAA